jgi:hypothetical protein
MGGSNRVPTKKELIAGALLACIAIVVWCVVAPSLWVKDSDFWAAETAIATAFAGMATFLVAFLALWLAERVRKEAEMSRARLAAIRLVPILERMLDDVKKFQSMAGMAQQKLSLPRPARDTLFESVLRKSLMRLTDTYSSDEIAHLAPVFKDGAQALAEARSLLWLLHEDVIKSGLDLMEERVAQRTVYIPHQKKWLKCATAVEPLLEIGLAQCRKAKWQ